MKRIVGFVVLALLLAAGPGAQDGRAQYTMLPIHYSPNSDTELKTIMFYGDYLFAESNIGEYRPLAGKVVLNLGRLNFSGGAGVLIDSELDNELSLGASVGLDLYFVSPSAPTVTFLAAAGYADLGDGEGGSLKRWDLPIGVGFAWYLPAIDWIIEPWVAPRAHARLLEGTALGTDIDRSDFGFGISGGMSVMHASGPGLHLAADVLRIDDPVTGESHTEFMLSGGIHFKFVLP